MKNKILWLLVAFLIVLLTGCVNIKDKEAVIVSKKPVKITKINETQGTKELAYNGVARPEEVRKISFKASGKIASIKVEKGQKVSKGDILAILDSTELSFAVEAAKAAKAGAAAQYQKSLNGATPEDIDLASLNVTKAQKAYEFSKDTLDKIKTLYDEGAASKQDLDKVKLEYEVTNQEYLGAKTLLQQVTKGAREEDKQTLKSQMTQADVDLRYKSSAVTDATLKSDTEGYVMDILFEEGEMISAGYPIIILGSNANVVSFGLNQEDVKMAKIGNPIRVESQDSSFTDKIKSIEKNMDMETRTYNTEVLLDNNAVPSGTILKVFVPMEQYTAIIIPIVSIMRGNYDYVYVIDNGIAKKKQIKLGDIHEDLVEVVGLSQGDQLVLEGMKNINDGDIVEIIQ